VCSNVLCNRRVGDVVVHMAGSVANKKMMLPKLLLLVSFCMLLLLLFVNTVVVRFAQQHNTRSIDRPTQKGWRRRPGRNSFLPAVVHRRSFQKSTGRRMTKHKRSKQSVEDHGHSVIAWA
jgi:hypothetical protein